MKIKEDLHTTWKPIKVQQAYRVINETFCSQKQFPKKTFSIFPKLSIPQCN